MSDSMMSAIKARRGGDSSGGGQMPSRAPQSDMGQSADQDGGMQGLVESLNDDQKKELLSHLTESMGMSQGPAIAKGGQSTQEKAAIGQRANEENESEDSDDGDEMAESGSGLSQDESDDVQMQMLDRKALNGGGKPLNLNQRAQMQAAEKLKSKGKIK